jgi:hypothetical protein
MRATCAISAGITQFDRPAHWQATLPGRVHEVGYGALVANQRVETERLLAHCRLPWDEYAHFERNANAVATASAVQVRQPLYASSVGRWRRYRHCTAAARRIAGGRRAAGRLNYRRSSSVRTKPRPGASRPDPNSR